MGVYKGHTFEDNQFVYVYRGDSCEYLIESLYLDRDYIKYKDDGSIDEYALLGPGALIYRLDDGETQWEYHDGIHNQTRVSCGSPPIFTNFIIYTSSERDAVYYDPDGGNGENTGGQINFDSTSMLLGWLIGSRIAEQRKKAAAGAGDGWETLYENAVTYAETKVGNPVKYSADVWSDEEPPAVRFYEGETIRLTADGVSKIYTVKLDEYGEAYFGNRYLSFDAIDGEGDTGDDFCFTVLVESYGFQYLSFARNPGTYQIKIERMKKEPVAYLYNGVRQPPLPEWNKEKYPCAILYWAGYGTSGSVWFFALSEPGHLTMVDSEGRYCIGVEDGVTFLQSRFTYGLEQWSSDFSDPVERTGKALLVSYPKWANYNVQNADGTVYLSASEPVPVYE